MHCSEAKSNLFSVLSINDFLLQRRQRRVTLTQWTSPSETFTAKHVAFLVLSGTASSTSVLTSSSVIEEKRSISKFVRQTGVIGCERTLSVDKRYSAKCHDSTNHAREEMYLNNCASGNFPKLKPLIFLVNCSWCFFFFTFSPSNVPARIWKHHTESLKIMQVDNGLRVKNYSWDLPYNISIRIGWLLCVHLLLLTIHAGDAVLVTAANNKQETRYNSNRPVSRIENWNKKLVRILKKKCLKSEEQSTSIWENISVIFPQQGENPILFQPGRSDNNFS